MRIDSATGINSALTGSFSGSFIGDGANLTGVAASSFNLDALDALGGATVDQADNLLVSDAGTEKKITFSNLEDTVFGNVSGDGTIAAGGALTLTDGNGTRTNLGLAIGTDVQAFDAQLSDVAGLAVTDGGFIVGDGSNFVLETGATVRTSLGLGTGDSPTFTGLTLSGDLTVNGTTTTVNSNTLNIGDNIIALNGVGSTLGGIAVNDANSASGSLLWDGANNYWIAGVTGSEAQIRTTATTIDISGDTNLAVSDTSGQTGINMSLTGDTISGVVSGLDTDNDVRFDSLGIGTNASGTTGEIRATNDITAFYSSDERLKQNIADLEGALDKVNAMRGVTFDWKELSEEERKTIHSHEGHDLGVIAQEVQAVYPELVHQRDHGYLSVDYVKLTAVLIQAVKELNAKVEACMANKA